ncbi:MAG: hypothetical protein JO129_03650 [Candidatus Dependentiae bacterium]|nr:hypothetical protein [Candidatus Dependentiae bacterium]
MKKIITFIVLVISAHMSFAENKQQIFLSNQFGSEVTVNLTWKSKSFPYFSSSQEVNLRMKDKEFMIKAPYSQYKLIGMHVVPTINIQNMLKKIGISQKDLLEEDLDDSSENSNDDSLDEAHIRNHTYFIIENSGEESQVKGQNKIFIMGYQSKKQYEDELAKDAAKNNPSQPKITEVLQKVDVALKQNNPKTKEIQKPVYQKAEPTLLPAFDTNVTQNDENDENIDAGIDFSNYPDLNFGTMQTESKTDLQPIQPVQNNNQGDIFRSLRKSRSIQ